MPMIHFGAETWAPYALYAAAIVVFFLSMFRWPELGLFYLIPLMPSQSVRYSLLKFPLGNQIVDLVLLAVIIGVAVHHRSLLPKTPLTRVLLLLILFTFGSLWLGSLINGFPLPLSAGDRRLANWKNIMIILPALYFVTYSAIRTKKQMAILLIVMGLGVINVSRSFRSNSIAGKDYSTFSYRLRQAGTMGHAGVNGLAAFETQVCIFAVALALFEKRWLVKAAIAGVAVYAGYCVVYSLSRGAYVAFAATMLAISLLKRPWWLAAGLLLIPTWEVVLPNAVRERILMTGGEGGAAETEGEVDHSAASRLRLWEDAIELAKSNLLIGSGYDTYEFMGRDDTYRDTHNLYLKILVETGIVGVAIFLYLLLRSTWLGWSLYRAAKGSDPFLASIGLGMALYMICVWIVNVFGDRWMFYQISGYTFVLLGLTARARAMFFESRQPGAVPDGVRRDGAEGAAPLSRLYA